MTTLHLKKSISPATAGRGFLLIPLALALAWFALAPTGQAQLPSPAPDGGYPGENTAEGDGALSSVTTGTGNTATGFQALFSNTTGSDNTANGGAALSSNTTGNDNTANGVFALFNNTTAGQNVAIGTQSLSTQSFSNAGVGWSSNNVAVGYQALNSNQPTSIANGINNTAVGTSALQDNTTGASNTATGLDALFSNTTGSQNTANGSEALIRNTTGSFNTAEGTNALFSNTTGGGNTAIGFDALSFNTTGGSNIAIGFDALFNNTTGNNNTANGRDALLSNTTGSNNIALGLSAGVNLTTGSNNIDIGNPGIAGEGQTTHIGTQGTQTKTFIAGIFGTAVSGSAVKINNSGQIGVAPSSARFKDEIKPMDKASQAILSLKPVTFRYKKEIDPERAAQFGLVAEQVEKVNPDLVARDANGQIYTVRYDAVNAMLLNEFLKEHQKVEQLEATAVRQQKQIEALTAGLQKVSAQVELKQSSPQMAVNNQ
jgi:hypothetical protein